MNFRASVAPKILAFSFGDEQYELGMSAQVTCIALEGDAPFDIRWTMQSRTHSAASTVESMAARGITVTKIGAKSSVLQIDSIDAAHAGNYTCHVSNAVASRNYSAELDVVGP